MHKLANRFITFEGIEGAGKSTQIQLLGEYLKQQHQQVIITREPGGTPIADQIRELLLNRQEEALTDSSELLLMFAARSQHLSQVILPALKQGAWVLCDRFTDSTLAYQGFGRGMDQTMISQLKEWVQGDLHPGMTFLFDMPVKLALDRVQQRGKKDRFEEEDLQFHTRVKEGFLNLYQREPERIVLIDALQSIEAIQQILIAHVATLG
ncbi:MAG TPA: dTMP kinase [Gammaproteobacteria bacterium]|nr:dTMP kinase [Gammaproteobacteria bacterium]